MLNFDELVKSRKVRRCFVRQSVLADKAISWIITVYNYPPERFGGLWPACAGTADRQE